MRPRGHRRLRHHPLHQLPDKLGRQSRFRGSHIGGAWLVLFFIFSVLWTMFLFREPPRRWALHQRGRLGLAGHRSVDAGWSHGLLEFLEGLGLLLHIGVMLAFLIEVVHSKHLHIFAGPINVAFERPPVALGPPSRSWSPASR
ncbi:MAG: hypothetical protein IPH03_08115 [Tetrasphaera sp.]|nr:hypothetical protein [Tetrasphaera sp.]